MDVIERKTFMKLAAGSLLAGAATPRALAQAPERFSTAAPARQATFLVRGADLLTMDDKNGELLATDILIKGGKIAAIGKNLPAGDAKVIEAAGMILMPGMIDGHRHTWQAPLSGLLVKTSPAYRTYFEYVNMKVGVSYRPEDAYFSNFLGGLTAIDTGVTAIIDHAHITHTPEKAAAAAKGLKDSGIGGFFCYQISFSPTYATGKTPFKTAYQEFMGGPDQWHYDHAAKVRDTYFSSSEDPLQFGVALSHVEYAPRTPESVLDELRKARTLEARLMTQHIQGQNGDWAMGLPATYRVIPALEKAGLLGPDYHLSHGNGLSDEELRMLAAAGSKMTSTALGEFPYEFPSAHGRAWKQGVAVGIGIDVAVAVTADYFEHVRAAWMSLFRTPEGRTIVGSMTSKDILGFATIGGARSLGIDNVTGSISVGKRADLVLLRTGRIGFPVRGSLADRVVNFASQQDIDSVWVDGKLRKRGGEMLGVNWGALKQKSEQTLEYALKKADAIEFVR